MAEAAGPSAGRQVLREALRDLETRALHGRDRTEAIAEANRALRRAGFAPLSPTRVGGWFEKGSPAKDFDVLWALVRVLLTWSGLPEADSLTGPERARAVARWTSARELWATRWEQAKDSRPAVAPPSGKPPLLGEYLRAAQMSAVRHPYPGGPDSTEAAGGPPLPSLGDVYVRQQAYLTGTGEPSGRSTGGLPVVPAGRLFQGDSVLCLLVAGPGGGKSTLLRSRLAEAAGQWLEEPGRSGAPAGMTVPVVVSARALVAQGPLPTALAKAVTGELQQFGLLDELPAEFFRHPPRPGARWLVMVDGLDEIPDAGSRDAVWRMLAAAAGAEDGPYRFVVATRPLPASELGGRDSPVPRYELRPFSRQDQLTHATRFFEALDDPGRHARAFLSGIRDARLDVLARTPLMAAMLCRLYAAEPGRPLPAGRSGAYRSFVELLYARNTHKGVRATHDEVVMRFRDRHQIPADNRAAEHAARQVRDHLPALIDHLAYERFHGNLAAAAEILAGHLRVNRPQVVAEDLWSAFLGDLLRPTGVLAQRGADLDFLHQTLLEYHAARHATRDAAARAGLLDIVLPAAPQRGWQAPNLEPSYAGFLLDGLLGPGDRVAAEAVRRLADIVAGGSADACSFLAAQVGLATALPPDSTVDQLTAFADNLSLTTVMYLTDRLNIISPRTEAAWALAQMPGHREDGAARLAGIADNPESFENTRGRAAEALSRVDGYEAEGAARLARMADSLTEPVERVRTAWALAQVEGHREDGAARLAGIAGASDLEDRYRVMAAAALARLDGSEARGASVLAALAAAPDVDPAARQHAFHVLGGIDGRREAAAAKLVELVGSWSLDGILRLEAARSLTQIEGYRDEGVQRLTYLAHTWSLDAGTRVLAAADLGRFDDYRGVAAEALAGLARDGGVGFATRMDAAQALARVEGYREEGVARLLKLGEGIDLDELELLELAEALEEVGVAWEPPRRRRSLRFWRWRRVEEDDGWQ
ncbi:NACHT domain-containing protein [Kitasatospora cineracea]